MADDFLNDPAEQGFPSELDTTSPYSGNRPASGARRATPGEVLSQGFQGAQNAGDFLGLDTEFTASQDPNQGYAPGGQLDLVPPPSTQDAAGYDPAYAQAVPAPAPMPEGDPVQEFAEAPSAFQFGEDLGSDEGEFAPLEEPASSKKPLLVGALLLAGLGAGGMLYGPALYARFFGSTPKVAVAPPAAQPTAARAEKTPPAREVAPPTTAAAVESGGAPAGEAVRPAPDPLASEPKPAPVVPRFTPTRATEPSLAASEDGASDDGEVAPPPESPLQGAAVGTPARSLAAAFPNLMGSEYEWASTDQLELIWRGSEVPLEAVKAPAKTTMPRVGNVRVFTTSGDVFEGRLYAVGQNRVWLDTQPGRVGLDGDKVERIEVLPPLPEGTQLSGDAALGAGGKRVGVRVPGGMLYGRVLKAEGQDVTLALSDGGRVRVKASEVLDLGPGRAVVVRR